MEVDKEKVLHEASEKMTEVAKKEIPVIYDFTLKLVREFGSFIKSVVVFGSFVRGDIRQESDIDFLVLVDDASVRLSSEVLAYYNKELDQMLKKQGSQLRFHVTTVTLSEWFDALRRGDPLIITILRNGVPIVDAGFFSPMKLLLHKGRIRPTQEAINLSLNRALFHLDDYMINTMNAINSLYWAAVEAAHAALMTLGSIPASPDFVSREMKKYKAFSAEDRSTFEGIYKLMKEVVHRKRKDVSTKELELWKNKVTKFVNRMEKLAKA